MSDAPAPKLLLRTWHVAVLASAWVAALVLGQRTMLSYDFSPAAVGTPPANWPSASAISRTPGLPTIVLVAHPRCPCTRASIEELAILLARLHNRATAAVIFVRPLAVSEDWEKTDLWNSAKRIPGVTVLSDLDGIEAARFGAQASGQTMLYSEAWAPKRAATRAIISASAPLSPWSPPAH